MPPRQAPGRHSANVASLVAGVVCCGIALGWILVEAGTLAFSDLGWLLPAVLIGAGGVGVATSIHRGRRRSARRRGSR